MTTTEMMVEYDKVYKSLILSLVKITKKEREEKSMVMSETTIDLQLQSIDNRVKRLERINDDWMARNGEINPGVYEQIQELMDQRDFLVSQKMLLD